MIIEELKFDEFGLLPTIVQEVDTGEVLMLAYVNKESLNKTLESGVTWFYSRSRKELWNKGQTSGNIQELISLKYDCDMDSLLMIVKQKGVACHTGEKSCFYRSIYDKKSEEIKLADVLPSIYERVEDRKKNPKAESYTNYLFDKGLDKILKKVGEEAAETIIAAKNQNTNELISEVSDLLYHLTVLLVEKDVTYEDIALELFKRYGKS